MIDITPCAAAAYAHCPRGRVDMNKLDRRQIDHQAIVPDSQPAGVMAAAPYGDLQALFAGKMNCRHYVGDVGALDDHAWFAVNHGVVNLSLCVITRIVRLD